MQGVPWAQVQQALIKMLELTRTDARIKVRALAYNYESSFLDLTGDTSIDTGTIKAVRATGSTNFVGVFEELGKLFKSENSKESKIKVQNSSHAKEEANNSDVKSVLGSKGSIQVLKSKKYMLIGQL